MVGNIAKKVQITVHQDIWWCQLMIITMYMMMLIDGHYYVYDHDQDEHDHQHEEADEDEDVIAAHNVSKRRFRWFNSADHKI